MKNQKVLEALADIAYIAGEMKFHSGNSRADIAEFIYWANEFEKKHSKTNWDEADYSEGVPMASFLYPAIC